MRQSGSKLNQENETVFSMGEEFWNELVQGIVIPDGEKEPQCQCRNMYVFMKRLEEMADETVKEILCRVCHGLNPSLCHQARQEFPEAGGLDAFLQKHGEEQWKQYVALNREREIRSVNMRLRYRRIG